MTPRKLTCTVTLDGPNEVQHLKNALANALDEGGWGSVEEMQTWRTIVVGLRKWLNDYHRSGPHIHLEECHAWCCTL